MSDCNKMQYSNLNIKTVSLGEPNGENYLETISDKTTKQDRPFGAIALRWNFSFNHLGYCQVYIVHIPQTTMITTVHI